MEWKFTSKELPKSDSLMLICTYEHLITVADYNYIDETWEIENIIGDDNCEYEFDTWDSSIVELWADIPEVPENSTAYEFSNSR
jgi:hypothetical protein